MLIAFEGVAGTGKTTLGLALSQKFNNAVFVEEFATDFADGYIQSLIERDPYLRLHASIPTPRAQAMLLMAALAYKYETQILPALSTGKIVIVDRYTDSIRAIQPETIRMQQGDLNEQDVGWITACLSPLPKPDRVFFLDCDFEIIKARLKERGIVTITQEAKTFIEKVKKNYLETLATNPKVTFFTNDGTTDDAVSSLYQEMTTLIKTPRPF